MSFVRRTLGVVGPTPIGGSILGVVAVLIAVATYVGVDRLLVGDARSASSHVAPAHVRSGKARTTADAPPSAAQFALLFVALGNLYGEEHSKAERLAHPDCVQASAGHYMCSYAVVRPRRDNECHLIQAEWTPGQASTYRVTLGGRVARCHTLRQALDSLR
jgi:hypothetical protein